MAKEQYRITVESGEFEHTALEEPNFVVTTDAFSLHWMCSAHSKAASHLLSHVKGETATPIEELILLFGAADMIAEGIAHEMPDEIGKMAYDMLNSFAERGEQLIDLWAQKQSLEASRQRLASFVGTSAVQGHRSHPIQYHFSLN